MEIRERTKEELHKDLLDYVAVVGKLIKLFESKNEGYGGLWAVNDLKMRFADIERKFVRLAAQVWYESSPASLEEIYESVRDMASYTILMMIEIERKMKEATQ